MTPQSSQTSSAESEDASVHTKRPTMGHVFVVEEQRGGPLTNNGLEIQHWTVNASSPQEAFAAAEELSGREFLYSADELVEVCPDYLWGAADGSSIWFWVRKVGIRIFPTHVGGSSGD